MTSAPDHVRPGRKIASTQWKMSMFFASHFKSLVDILFQCKIISLNFFLHFRFKKDDLVEVRWENEKGEVKWEPATIVNTPNMFNKSYKICWQKKVGDVYEPIWVTKEKGEYSS